VKSRCLSLLVILFFVPAVLWGRDVKEQARIEFLLHYVESSRGITFIRNGSDHDPVAAAKHLRMKLDYAGERVKTAEDFIKYCAAESSLTHQKYKVRKEDGTVVNAADYFTERLRQFDERNR
jgi:hypothetical protein